MSKFLRIVFIVCVLLLVLMVMAGIIVPWLSAAFPQLNTWVQLPAFLQYSPRVKVIPQGDDVSIPGLNSGLPGTGVPPFIYLLFAVVVAFLAIRLAMRESSRNRVHLDEDESRMMQELHVGLTRLEDRVESLESVLIEQKRHGAGKTKSKEL